MSNNTPPPPRYTPPPESPHTRRRRRRRNRRVIIGLEHGRFYEYTPTGRIPIPGQRLARIAPQTALQGARVNDGIRADTSGAVLAAAFLGVFGGVLAVMLLIKELIA